MPNTKKNKQTESPTSQSKKKTKQEMLDEGVVRFFNKISSEIFTVPQEMPAKTKNKKNDGK